MRKIIEINGLNIEPGCEFAPSPGHLRGDKFDAIDASPSSPPISESHFKIIMKLRRLFKMIQMQMLHSVFVNQQARMFGFFVSGAIHQVLILHFLLHLDDYVHS